MEKVNSLNYTRILELNEKIKSGKANKTETDEYMRLIYQNGSITEKQFDDYTHGRNVEDILKAGLVIGGIILLGYLLSKLFD